MRRSGGSERNLEGVDFCVLDSVLDVEVVMSSGRACCFCCVSARSCSLLRVASQSILPTDHGHASVDAVIVSIDDIFDDCVELSSTFFHADKLFFRLLSLAGFSPRELQVGCLIKPKIGISSAEVLPFLCFPDVESCNLRKARSSGSLNCSLLRLRIETQILLQSAVAVTK